MHASPCNDGYAVMAALMASLAAACNGVSPLASAMLASAPCWHNRRTKASWPHMDAGGVSTRLGIENRNQIQNKSGVGAPFKVWRCRPTVVQRRLTILILLRKNDVAKVSGRAVHLPTTPILAIMSFSRTCTFTLAPARSRTCAHATDP